MVCLSYSPFFEIFDVVSLPLKFLAQQHFLVLIFIFDRSRTRQIKTVKTQNILSVETHGVLIVLTENEEYQEETGETGEVLGDQVCAAMSLISI